MDAKELWEKYIASSNIESDFDAWSFGDSADLLAKLVVEGKKTATSSAYDLYAIYNEKLPEVGQYSVILDSKKNAICIIKTTKVYIKAFKDISKEHAYKEGEGDRSLEYWQNIHQSFFKKGLEKARLVFTKDIKVVCEEFEVVYK